MTKHKNHQFKTILGIETSCDETAAAVISGSADRVTLLSNVISSSANIQAKYGGVIPEQAAREQLKTIIPVITEALRQGIDGELSRTAQCKPSDIDALAVTQGPGLIGSLLVGVETAKTLSLVWGKPLIPVNHLIGHFYANWIKNQSSDISFQSSGIKHLTTDSKASLTAENSIPNFPCLGLLASGGHTDLVLMKNHGQFEYLGGTRDDAAGECFDKSARLLGLPYPGGPAIAEASKTGNPKAYNLPRPMMKGFSAKGGLAKSWDFSFSGLKTAIAYLVTDLKINNHQTLSKDQQTNLAASIQEAITDTLVEKTIKAAQYYNVEYIMVAGGVTANLRLKELLSARVRAALPRVQLFIPPAKLCTDNAAMISTAAYFNPRTIDPLLLQAKPGLSFD